MIELRSFSWILRFSRDRARGVQHFRFTLFIYGGGLHLQKKNCDDFFTPEPQNPMTLSCFLIEKTLKIAIYKPKKDARTLDSPRFCCTAAACFFMASSRIKTASTIRASAAAKSFNGTAGQHWRYYSTQSAQESLLIIYQFRKSMMHQSSMCQWLTTSPQLTWQHLQQIEQQMQFGWPSCCCWKSSTDHQAKHQALQQLSTVETHVCTAKAEMIYQKNMLKDWRDEVCTSWIRSFCDTASVAILRVSWMASWDPYNQTPAISTAQSVCYFRAKPGTFYSVASVSAWGSLLVLPMGEIQK